MCGGSSESHPVLSEMLTDVIEAWGLAAAPSQRSGSCSDQEQNPFYQL